MPDPLLNIVLLHPQIPNNTGNVGRTAAVTGCRLHIVHPIAFDMSEKARRRAGLDYWHLVDCREHASWEAYLEAEKPARAWLYTTASNRPHWQATFQRGDHLLFGSETEGAPKAAKALADINFREGSHTLIWVLPPVGGLVVGAGVGVLLGGMYAASNVENADRGWIFGPFIGTFAGASLGAITVSLPLDAWARIDDGDRQRREHARAELAEAGNVAERQRLGLTEAP